MKFAEDLPFYQELDSRGSDGLTITMYNEVGTSNILVAIEDVKDNSIEVVQKPEGKTALEFFYHAMAYTRKDDCRTKIYVTPER